MSVRLSSTHGSMRSRADARGLSHANRGVAVTTSRGLLAIQHLPTLVGVRDVMSPREAARCGAEVSQVLVWGRRPSAEAGHQYAAQHGLPVTHLEDGWVRTTSANPHSRLTYSLIVDSEGVYYDSRSPSGIENWLNQNAQLLSDSSVQAASLLRQRIVNQQITKYNYCRSSDLTALNDRPFVLLIDQTRDDASVRFGGMDDTRFGHMLHAAIDENPHATIVVRTHPDVVAGRREGYLTRWLEEEFAHAGVHVAAGGDNPYPWLQRAERVYVGTSQLGYEALMAERPVTVFGRPFYSGWGLTDDRQEPWRRDRQADVDTLFHAAHVEFSRYCHPVSGEPWTLSECLDHVCLQKEMFARNARHFQCQGITPWKRRYVSQYLRSPDGSVAFGNDKSVPDDATTVTWSYKKHPEGTPATTPVWRMEDGFLRSTGLGSDFAAPSSLVVDTQGLYFDPSAPSDLEVMLNSYDCTPKDSLRAQRLRLAILAAGVTKYNVGDDVTPPAVPESKPTLLVVGQVEDDESIRRGSPQISTNSELLQRVRELHPDAYVVYKPHPDVVAGNRTGAVADDVLSACADVVDETSSIVAWLEVVSAVHTMTSLSGFEALLRGKTVHTYGSPFYAGWGLTHDAMPTPRRQRQRTLDELVFLALIAYPRYLHIDTGEFVTPEDLVMLLLRENQQHAASRTRGATSWPDRQLQRAANVYRGLRYAP